MKSFAFAALFLGLLSLMGLAATPARAGDCYSGCGNYCITWTWYAAHYTDCGRLRWPAGYYAWFNGCWNLRGYGAFYGYPCNNNCCSNICDGVISRPATVIIGGNPSIVQSGAVVSGVIPGVVPVAPAVPNLPLAAPVGSPGISAQELAELRLLLQQLRQRTGAPPAPAYGAPTAPALRQE